MDQWYSVQYVDLVCMRRAVRPYGTIEGWQGTVLLPVGPATIGPIGPSLSAGAA